MDVVAGVLKTEHQMLAVSQLFSAKGHLSTNRFSNRTVYDERAKTTYFNYLYCSQRMEINKVTMTNG